ncbi:hypothetical protein M8C21_011872 [Ambrosia artemisiifolia]|uniref:BCAS3 domain-containing protein n=1 Tax=Ambrosia artemisiifolia TaxID=4212 RepID=A0AAD5CA57_AMBAR|nr:hypothetical protein M8C21_011872 [Ambrosia artemisiifolia]
MRKTDQKQRYGGGNNGFIPSSFRSLSSYLRIVQSGASTVASTVRSAASAASTIVDRDADAGPDQVLWAGFDKLECEGGISRRLLLLGYQYGFQVWDVEDANNVRNIVSRYDGAVSFMQILPKPTVSNHSHVEYPNERPLLVICADGSFSAGVNSQGGPSIYSNGNIKTNHDQINVGYVPTVVWFYSLKSQAYIKELKFRSVVYSVRCSSRVVAVLQAAQVHCFDVATLEREYTILTNPIVTNSSRFENIGLGPLAVGPRWIAYSGSAVALPNTRVSPQHLTHSKTFTSPSSNGSIVAHYAKQSSKHLALGIATLGDIGYKKLSRYYSEFLPDDNTSQPLSDPGRKDRGNSNGRLPDTENVGMVIVRDVVSKSVIAQFKAHDSPIASLCFDPSGTLLVTASVHGHNFNYALRLSPEIDTAYESLSPDIDSKLIVEPIQKWNICSKQNRKDREENVDIYGENGHTDNRKVFPERTENGNSDYFDRMSKIKKENANLEGKNHVYISEVELHTNQLQTPLWARAQINFQSLTISDVNVDGVNNSKGEFEIEKVPTQAVEARSRYLVPAGGYLQEPKVQTTRVPDMDYNNNGLYEHEKLFKHESSSDPVTDGFENGNEETGEDVAGQMPIDDCNGLVNSDDCPISHTRPEVVDNREHSVGGTQSKLVNNYIDQKLENQFEDQGNEFD